MRLNLFLLLLTVLSAPFPALSAEESQGKLIFAIEVLEIDQPLVRINADGSTVPLGRTGLFYYCKESGPGECEPRTLFGRKLADGKEMGRSGPGYETLFKEMKAIPLSSFNVQREIESAIANRDAEAQKNGISVLGRVVFHGAKYRILYNFNGVNIDYTAWNPGFEIKDLAAYSPNLKNLNDLLDLIALDYGRSQLW